MATVKGGAITQAKTNQAADPAKTVQGLVISMKDQIAKALPKAIAPDRFTRMVLTALSTNPQLAKCTPQSFLGAMMQSAQLGLEPNTPLGQAYLIPYGSQVQFQIGYRGALTLAYRSGEIRDVSAHEVHANDEFEYEMGLEPKLRHKPALMNRGEVILYYAVYHTKDGGYGFEVMSKDDIVKHMQQFSKAASKGSSPWQTNFDSMAKKTVIKRLLKYAPMQTEIISRAMEADGTIKTKIAADMIDLPDENTIEAEAEEVPANVDPETGEIKENPGEPPMSEDDRVLQDSLM